VGNPAGGKILSKSLSVSKTARKSALEMTFRSKASHIGSCLSVIDLLAVAFTQKMLDINYNHNEILLSKGHAAAGLYSVLNALDLLETPLQSYCEDGSQLYGHVNHHVSQQIPLSTGSLGHGLPFGLGIAIANKKHRNRQKTIVIISDGELNEGTTWESALVAPQHSLSELILIIDRNQIQSLGFTEETLRLNPIDKKWESFGWDVIEIDGHDHAEILRAISTKSRKPLCVIANTVKGKGVSFMEDSIAWHYKSPTLEELNIALAEIDTTVQ
jgi:transketolase